MFSDSNLLYYNARSLLSKIGELCARCENPLPGEVCIVENQAIWRNNGLRNLITRLLFCLDHNRHGGGVLMYVIFFCKIRVAWPSRLEFLLISVYIKSQWTNVSILCCPPNSSISAMDIFISIMESLDQSCFSNFNFVLLGDFNIDLCNPHHPLYSIFNTGSRHNTQLQQWQRKSTWHCILHHTTLTEFNFTPYIANSDHNGLLLKWNWKRSSSSSNCAKPTTRPVWRYSQADFDFNKTNELLAGTNWEQLLDTSDVNQALQSWENTFMHVNHVRRFVSPGVLYLETGISLG